MSNYIFPFILFIGDFLFCGREEGGSGGGAFVCLCVCVCVKGGGELLLNFNMLYFYIIMYSCCCRFSHTALATHNVP